MIRLNAGDIGVPKLLNEYCDRCCEVSMRATVCCCLTVLVGVMGCGESGSVSNESTTGNDTKRIENIVDPLYEKSIAEPEQPIEEAKQIPQVTVQEFHDGTFHGIVEVTGKVSYVLPHSIHLVNDDGKTQIFGKTKDPRPWEKINIGGTATLRGRAGFRSVEDSDIIASTGGKSILKFTAEEFLNVIFDHADLTDRPFQHKQVLITGVVKRTKVTDWPHDRVHTILVGLKNVDLPIGGDPKGFENVKPGDTVTVIGICRYHFFIGHFATIGLTAMVPAESE